MLEYELEIKPKNLIKGQGLAKLMAKSNLHALDINLIAALSEEQEEDDPFLQVSDMFISSPWYSDIVYVLQHSNPPPKVPKGKGRSLKLKVSKYCILDGVLYWKDPGGVLLNCLVETEAKDVMKDFHKGDCGSHHFLKTTTNKILRAGFYWPTLFSDVYKIAMSCHECQIFQGKRNIFPLPLQPISISDPFQQLGLDFIGEIHPSSSTQHKWILTTTNYSTKWIKAIPPRQAIDYVIIQLIESNILSRFGYPQKILLTILFPSSQR